MSVALDTCPSCGGAVVAGDRFCERCGAEFDDVVPALAAPIGAALAPPNGAASSGSARSTQPISMRPACVRCAGVVDADGYCTECGVKQPSPRDHIELDLGGAAFVCDRGRRHARNEDSAALGARAGRVAAVVCDGVSSAPDSDRASQAAVDAALAELLAVGPVGDALERATTAAQLAASALAAKPASVPSCTYVAAVVEPRPDPSASMTVSSDPRSDPRSDPCADPSAPGRPHAPASTVTVAWVGDSRAYLVDSGGARRLTSDDSWAQDVVDAGEMTEAQAMADARAHQITRWLGADAVQPVVARTATADVVGPARLLVCSDGLWNELSCDADLLAIGTLEDSPLVAARRLVDHANAAGGRDNITVTLIDIPWTASTASPSEESHEQR